MYNHRRNSLALAFALLVAFPLYGQIHGQPAAGEGQNNDLAAKFQAAQQRSQQLQSQLNNIAAEARQKNPHIAKMEERLQELYQSKLTEYGYPTEKELQDLQKMQARLQSQEEDMAADERQRLTSEFQKKLAALQESQSRAQENEEVQTALQQFQQAQSKAMSDVDEKAPEIQRELSRLQQEIQQLHQQLIQRQQRQQQAE